MPPKGKSKAKAKPRRYVKKRSAGWSKGPATTTSVKTLAVPDRMLLKLPYYDAKKMSGNTAAYYDWNLNSIWDPDRSGTGHQPLAFDQWGSLFNRYRVYGVTARFSATNLGDVPVRIGIIGDNVASGSQYLTDQAKFEQPHMKSFILGNAQGMNTRTFKTFFSCAKIQGSPKARYNADNQFQSTWSNSPQEIICAHVVASSLDQTTALNIMWDVHFIYHIEAFDRYSLSISNTAPEKRTPELNIDTESSIGPTGPTGPTGDTGPTGPEGGGLLM